MIHVGGGGGGMPKGVSFNMDTQDKRVTRIFGSGIKVDMEMLEIIYGGGKLQFTPTHSEYLFGSTRWITTITPVSMILFH